MFPLSNQELTALTPAQIALWFIQCRDFIAAEKHKYEDTIKDSEEIMDTLKGEINRRFAEAGVTSIKTEYGTLVRSRKDSFSAQDKAAFVDWIRTTGNVEATQIRPSNDFIKELLEAGGQLPPGIEAISVMTATVRKS